MLSNEIIIINGMVRTKDTGLGIEPMDPKTWDDNEWWHENPDKYKFYGTPPGEFISNKDSDQEEYKGYIIRKNNDNKYDLFLNKEEKGYNFESLEKAKRRIDQYLKKYGKDSQPEIDFQGLKEK